jgi:hypothetical protein
MDIQNGSVICSISSRRFIRLRLSRPVQISLVPGFVIPPFFFFIIFFFFFFSLCFNSFSRLSEYFEKGSLVGSGSVFA